MPPKIIFVITKSNWGGAQRYVFELINALKENYEVALACGGKGPLLTKVSELGVRTIPLLNLKRDIEVSADFKSFFMLLKILRDEKPDVVHLNSSKIGALGALAARIHGTRHIIFTAHGWAYNEDRFFISKWIIKLIAAFTIILSHKTICVSEAIKRQAPFQSKKLVVVKNGIPSPQFLDRKQAREFLDTKAAQKENTFWVGSIGELHPIKGHSFAIEAFANIKNRDSFEYFILGGGELKKKLEEQIAKNNLENSVFLLGHVDNASLYLKAFDAFLFPSLSEGLGLTAIEAGYAGLPVIASNVGGIPEIIEDGKTGLLVPPKNSNAIAQKIEFIKNNEGIGRSLGEALFEKVKKEFSFERMLKETIAVYHLESDS